jgi:histidine ammonia-lyase
VRVHVAPLTEDRPLYEDIARVAEMLVTGALVDAARARAPSLA